MKKYSATLVSLSLMFVISTTMGMEVHDESKKCRNESKKCLRIFKELPRDIQQIIRQLLVTNIVTFLGQRPIMLTASGYHSIAAMDDNEVTMRTYSTDLETWDLATGRLKKRTSGVDSFLRIDSVICGDKVATKNGFDVKVCNIVSNACLLAFKEDNYIRAIAMDDDKIVTGSACTIRMRNIQTGDITHCFWGKGTILAITLYGDILLAGEMGFVQLWNLQTGIVKTLKSEDDSGHRNDVTSLAMNMNEDKVVTVCDNRTLKVYDIHTARLLKTFNRFNNSRDAGANVESVAINDHCVVYVPLRGPVLIFPLSPNLEGTPGYDSLKWICDEADPLQINFIRRVCQATADENKLILALPKNWNKIEEDESREQQDGRTYFTLPVRVREYVRNSLNIRRQGEVII